MSTHYGRLGMPYDTEENWNKSEKILYKGELAILSDPDKYGKYKIGDGVHKFSELEYVVGEQGPQGPKGDPGLTGLPGAPGPAAGFGTPTASIDNNVGVPSVEITASGADTKKVFNFVFKNLKGETGATGATGPQGPKGDTGFVSGISVSGNGDIISDISLNSDTKVLSVTKSKTNDQTPTYTEASERAKLTSGEKLSIAFGKISKAITDLISHIGNNDIHITTTERTNWNAAKSHANSTHARTDATKVEKSTTNGNVLINSTETTVYTHPTTSGNKHIPSGGSSGQILRWSADGTATWGTENNKTYSAGAGISLSGTTFSNSGVRSISSGSANGTISVNTNGTSAEVAVKGLGSAAYTASSDYAPSNITYYNSSLERTANTILAAPNGSNGVASFRKLVESDLPNSYLPLTGGTLTGSKGSIGLITDSGSVPKVKLTGNNNDEWQLDAFNGTMRLVDQTNAVPCLSVNRTEATMPGKLTLGDLLDLKPGAGEGGEIHLSIATNDKSHNGIVLDNFNGTFRIFGIPSADGTTITGVGIPLQINPYNKTITGGYTFVGDVNGTATQCNLPRGFVRRATSQTWGNQNGTFITCWETSNGGDISFRENNGQVNVIADGYFYQNEGSCMCLDTNNYSNYALPLSGGTMTGSIITPKDDNMGIIPSVNNYGQIGSSDKKFYRMCATNMYATNFYKKGVAISTKFDTKELEIGDTTGVGKIFKQNSSLIVAGPYKSGGGAGLEFSSCIGGILPCALAIDGAYMTFPINLGSSSRKFDTVYSLSSTLNSDKKEKKDITNLQDSEFSNNYVNAYKDMNFVRFKWKQNKNGGLETPPSSRNHYGIIAQDVEKLLNSYGINNYDNGIIKSSFFADNSSGAFITGGYYTPYYDEENDIQYDYSENVLKYKQNLDYQTFNEIIEKNISEITGYDLYANRSDIGYIMIEDNSKLVKDQPPVKINGIALVDKNDNVKKLNFYSDKNVKHYEWNDEDFSNPLTDAVENEDGSITISFNEKYSKYLIKVDDFNIFDYKKIIIDADYVGEYKVYLIPNAVKEHVNANVWDRGRADDSILTYGVDYNELHNMCFYALQQITKEQEKEIAQLKESIEELKGMITNAQV